ncbi:MAG: hypothetical protein DMG13_24665 [Acidobacteria bacterium]|nr:MAG: hypothetical protein DMG13_24665 [Acidobacteriota bacterium]
MRATSGVVEQEMSRKISRTGVEAARRKFTPEFLNRLDKIVTFQPLGTEQLKKRLIRISSRYGKTPIPKYRF